MLYVKGKKYQDIVVGSAECLAIFYKGSDCGNQVFYSEWLY